MKCVKWLWLFSSRRLIRSHCQPDFNPAWNATAQNMSDSNSVQESACCRHTQSMPWILTKAAWHMLQIYSSLDLPEPSHNALTTSRWCIQKINNGIYFEENSNLLDCPVSLPYLFPISICYACIRKFKRS